VSTRHDVAAATTSDSLATRYRRTRRVAAVATGVVALAALAPIGASADEDFILGSGEARAELVRVGPETGGLNWAPSFGQVIADYQNQVGRGQSRTIDLATLGLVLAAESCTGGDPTWPRESQPPTLAVDSRNEGAGDGETIVYQGSSMNGGTLGLGKQHARATDQPLGHAAVELGVLEYEGFGTLAPGGHAEATSQIIDGIRESRAVAVIPEINLGGGQLRLLGLRWEAIHRSGSDNEVLEAGGSFTFDVIEAGGQRFTMPQEGVDGLDQLTEAINGVLAPTGLIIEIPGPQVNELGTVTVNPLTITVHESPLGTQVLGPIAEGVQPARQAIFDAMIDFDCRTGNVITALDVVLGVATGIGSLDIELGGVSAFTEGQDFDDLFGGFPGFGNLPSEPGAIAPPAGPIAQPTPAVKGSVIDRPPAGVATPPSDPQPQDAIALPGQRDPRAVAVVPAASLPDGRAATLVTIGLLAALAVVGTALSDTRRSRNQRYQVVD